MESTIMLGKYSLPFVLSIILGLIFKNSAIPDQYKPYISAAVGIALGVAAMFYNVEYGMIAFPIVADYVLQGLIAGAAATGIYEMNKVGPTGTKYQAIDENGKSIPNARVVKYSKAKVVR